MNTKYTIFWRDLHSNNCGNTKMEYFTTKSSRIRIILLRNGGIAPYEKTIYVNVVSREK